MTYVELAFSLLVILIAAEVFTNALEHLGEQLGLSEGTTGSVFAAVGTAMPESMVPLVAFLAGSASVEVNADIGVGAILGAPLMLSTLSLSLMALSVLRKRGWQGHLRPERSGLRRDNVFFLLAFGLAITALFVPTTAGPMKALFAVALLLVYFIYVMLTLSVSASLVADGHGTAAHAPMLLCRLGAPDHRATAVLQLAIGLGLLILGAHAFVHGVEALSSLIGISPLLLSLLIIPIATELPEKVNSILWIRRGRDTLAFGNITGAMVFQGSVLPAIGIAMTPWVATPETVTGAVVTYFAALWLFMLARRGDLRVWHLAVNGGLYIAYVAFALSA